MKRGTAVVRQVGQAAVRLWLAVVVVQVAVVAEAVRSRSISSIISSMKSIAEGLLI